MDEMEMKNSLIIPLIIIHLISNLTKILYLLKMCEAQVLEYLFKKSQYKFYHFSISYCENDKLKVPVLLLNLGLITYKINFRESIFFTQCIKTDFHYVVKSYYNSNFFVPIKIFN